MDGKTGGFGRRPELARNPAMAALGSGTFDLLVIGGGITGAGVALDAAARGLRTALVEKGDFASGTSSASSKLVHGGLRYLRQYEVGLVFQSLAERQLLLRNAPHLVQPQLFVIPLLGKGGVADRTIARTYALGLSMYDVMGGFRIGHLHRRATAEEVHRHLPTLRLDRLVAGFTYYDARADDARLTLAIARTAALDHGAVVLNHAPVVDLLKNAAGKVCGATIEPEDGPSGGIEVKARAVVNATGVWAERIMSLDAPQAGIIRPAKGIHVAVPRAKVPCDAAVVLPSPRDGRNITVIPWEEATYIGTTDTDFEGDLDSPSVEIDDVDYLLEALNAAVTDPVSRSDVTGTWSGLRPLLRSAGRRRAPSARTADLSRRHKVLTSPSGLVTVTGGKLTTYRKMAADTVDVVVRLLGVAPRRCPTKHLALRGSRDLARWQRPGAAGACSLPADAFPHLLARYGDEVPELAALIEAGPELGERLIRGLPFLGAEVVYAARRELAGSVEDVLSRRMRVLLFDARAAASMARPVAELLAGELGWSSDEANRQVEEFTSLAASTLSMLGGDQVTPQEGTLR